MPSLGSPPSIRYVLSWRRSPRSGFAIRNLKPSGPRQSTPASLFSTATGTFRADVGGFAVAAGIVTAIGGRTAHAALVARQMGKPCIVGCAELSIDVAGRRAQLAGVAIKEGDWLS